MKPIATRLSLTRLWIWLGSQREGIGYGLFTLVVFVVTLAYSLPHDLIARRALDEATSEVPVRVRFAEVSFSFPNGYHFRDLRLTSEGPPRFQIEMPELTVSTPLTGLFSGQIDSASFSGTLYGGEIDGTTWTEDGRLAATVHAENLQIAPLYRRFAAAPGTVAGATSFDLEFSGDGRTLRSSQGSLSLTAREVAMSEIALSGIILPDLQFGSLRLEAALDGGQLKLERFEATGDEVTLTSEGTLLVRTPLSRSVLNLEVGIDVSAEARPGLRAAVSFLPKRRTGPANRWSLRGPLSAPSLR